MKNKKKILALFILLGFTLSLLLSFTVFAAAYQNQEKIPGYDQTYCFPDYIKQIINFGFAAIGILAMFMLAIGAYQYLMSAGNIGSADSAKATIGSALGGLALGLCAWLILNTINPDLVSMKDPEGLSCKGSATSTSGSGSSGGGSSGGGTGGGGGSGYSGETGTDNNSGTGIPSVSGSGSDGSGSSGGGAGGGGGSGYSDNGTGNGGGGW